MPASYEKLFLGVDGGASNITVSIINEKGEALYEDTVHKGANYQAISLESVIENLEEAVQQAAQSLELRPAVFDYSVLGLAGCNFDSDRQVITEAIQKSSLSSIMGGGFEVLNDATIALRAGTKDGVGIVLIAGTGSNCLGRNAQGEMAKAGGLSHILSDEGSGYDIGLRTLQAVVHSLDGRGGETALVEAVFTALQVSNLEELYKKVYEDYTSKSQIASLATVTVEMAERRDEEAMDILNHSVNELLLMVDAVMKKFNWRDEPISVVAVGSVIGNRNYVRQRFQTELLRISTRARLVAPTMSSAKGAALLAMEAK